LGRSKIGQQFADRLIQRQLTLLDQLHAGGSGYRLGHRGDPEHAIGGHRVILAEVTLAERALVDGLASGGRHRNDAGNLLGVAFLAQQLVDLRLGLHGGRLLRIIVMECCDPPPDQNVRQAARPSQDEVSRFRD
jgi:hypothetical protein